MYWKRFCVCFFCIVLFCLTACGTSVQTGKEISADSFMKKAKEKEMTIRDFTDESAVTKIGLTSVITAKNRNGKINLEFYEFKTDKNAKKQYGILVDRYRNEFTDEKTDSKKTPLKNGEKMVLEDSTQTVRITWIGKTLLTASSDEANKKEMDQFVDSIGY